MTISLAIQNTYDNIELGLFNDEKLIELMQADKTQASKQLIPLISSLITKHNLSLNNLNYIAVNQGPGPFTTLRVIIATANGLSFASNVPLIGIDGMQALLDEYHDQAFAVTIALLDAFNGDVFFAIQEGSSLVETGYKKNDLLIHELSARYKHAKVKIIGNAAQLYRDQLEKGLPECTVVLEAQTCSLKQINLLAHRQWINKNGLSHQLFPLYLKSQQYKNSLGQIKII